MSEGSDPDKGPIPPVEKKHYKVVGPATTHSKKLAVSCYTYEIQWINIEQAPNIKKAVNEAMTEILDQAFQDCHPKDRANVEINHEGLVTPILIDFTTCDMIDSAKILDTIENKAPKKGLNFDHDMNMTINTIHMLEKYR